MIGIVFVDGFFSGAVRFFYWMNKDILRSRPAVLTRQKSLIDTNCGQERSDETRLSQHQSPFNHPGTGQRPVCLASYTAAPTNKSWIRNILDLVAKYVWLSSKSRCSKIQ